jgi:hypothetical protein
MDAICVGSDCRLNESAACCSTDMFAKLIISLS